MDNNTGIFLLKSLYKSHYTVIFCCSFFFSYIKFIQDITQLPKVPQCTPVELPNTQTTDSDKKTIFIRVNTDSIEKEHLLHIYCVDKNKLTIILA